MSGDYEKLGTQEARMVLLTRHKGFVQSFLLREGMRLKRGEMLKLNPDRFASEVTRVALYNIRKRRFLTHYSIIERNIKAADREIYLWRKR